MVQELASSLAGTHRADPAAMNLPLMSPVSATTTVNCFNWSREVAMVLWERKGGGARRT